MEVREVSAAYGGLIDTAYDEVPVGYKRTEVGVIPEDWDTVKLGAHATFRTGPFGSALHKSDYVHGGIPVINPMQIVDGTLAPTVSMTISGAAARRLSEFLLCEGEVVIGRRGDMGRCAFVGPGNKGWLCGTGSMIVRPKPSLDGRFAQRLLSSAQAISAIEATSVGTTMVNLNQSTLKNLLVPIPPTRIEQEAIAEALSDADALIESLEQLLAKKRQIKQGAMQELLTGKKRLPGFKGKWRADLAGAIGRFRGGNGFPLAYQGSTAGDYPFFKVSDMNNAGNETEMVVANNYISGSVRKKLVLEAFPAGTIVFAKVGAAVHLERKKLLVMPSCIDNNMAGFIVGDEEIDNQFIHYFLLSFKLGSLVATTALPSLNSGVLREIRVPRPPTKAEQSAIAEVLSDMDTEIAALEARLTKTRQLKQAMMQELLTGRIRLVQPGLSGEPVSKSVKASEKGEPSHNRAITETVVTAKLTRQHGLLT